MKIIFDEYQYAEELLRKGFKDFLKYSDLLILAKYYRYLGNKNSEIKQKMVDFYKRNYPDYNEIVLGDKLDSAIKRSEQREIKLSIDIPITQGELDKIRTINNHRYEKVLFTMLAIARHNKMSNNNTSSRYFVNYKFSTILTAAKVYATKADRNKMKHYLFEKGMIVVPELGRMAEDNTREVQELLYADEKSDVAIIITDMQHITSFYPFHCEICGKPTEKTGRHQKMCRECWRKRHNELERERKKTKKV